MDSMDIDFGEMADENGEKVDRPLDDLRASGQTARIMTNLAYLVAQPCVKMPIIQLLKPGSVSYQNQLIFLDMCSCKLFSKPRIVKFSIK